MPWDKFFDAMQHIRDSGRQWPTISGEIGDMSISFGLSRDGSAIFVNEGPGRDAPKLAVLSSAADNKWYGNLRQKPAATKAQVWALLKALDEDPIKALSDMGQDLGYCMVCGRPLSNEESVHSGIGPVCRGRMGG